MDKHCGLLFWPPCMLNKNRAVARKPRDAAVNFDRYGVCRQLLSFVTRGKLNENGARPSASCRLVCRHSWISRYVTLHHVTYLLIYLLHTMTIGIVSDPKNSSTAMYSVSQKIPTAFF